MFKGWECNIADCGVGFDMEKVECNGCVNSVRMSTAKLTDQEVEILRLEALRPKKMTVESKYESKLRSLIDIEQRKERELYGRGDSQGALVSKIRGETYKDCLQFYINKDNL